MNQRQKVALWIGVVLTVATLLFPPWEVHFKNYIGQEREFLGYGFIVSGPPSLPQEEMLELGLRVVLTEEEIDRFMLPANPNEEQWDRFHLLVAIYTVSTGTVDTELLVIQLGVLLLLTGVTIATLADKKG